MEEPTASGSGGTGRPSPSDPATPPDVQTRERVASDPVDCHDEETREQASPSDVKTEERVASDPVDCHDEETREQALPPDAQAGERAPSDAATLVNATTRELAPIDAGRPAGPGGEVVEEQIASKVKQRLFVDPPAMARIARFTVLERIGHGGMGTVYAAYDEQLDRKVAVKILLEDELPDKDDRVRFLREAQALARLSHPHVVTVHEVGEADGELYLAMEFIRGQNLSQWRRTEKPGWRAVLEAFVQVGRGLVAVHQAGLVHRDLKPTNIMRRDDGVVKLLDFGLARAVADGPDPSLDDGTGLGSSMGSGSAPGSSMDSGSGSAPGSSMDSGSGSAPGSASGSSLDSGSGSSLGSGLSSSLTRPGVVMGTPAYMSPEQLDAEAVDARSDQFSFCVALYEAVHGERPYPGRTMQALKTSMHRGWIRSPPKDRLVPARLRTIVLQGLAVDPAQRWPSMEALLEQLQRLLAPRRSRWWALSASAALGVGLVGAGLVYQTERAYRADRGQRCTGARAQLEGTWDDGRRQQVEAAILSTALSYAPSTWARVEPRLDAYADAWVDTHTEACEATAIRHEQSEQAMHLRMRCLDQRRTSLRVTVDALAGADTTVVNNAIKLVVGLPALRRCDDLHWLEQQDQRVPPPEDADVAVQVEALRERLADIAVTARAGRYAEALEAVEPVVQRAEALAYPPLVAEALRRRGSLLRDAGEYAEAERDLQQAYTRAVKHHHDQVALHTAQMLTSVVGYRLARYGEGRQWGQMVALPLAERSGEPTEVATTLNHLGVVHSVQGKFEAAREHFQRALTIRENALGPDHTAVADSLNNLGTVYRNQGEYDKALECVARTLAIRQKALGTDHPHVALSLNTLGIVHSNRREYEQAKGYFDRALAIRLEALGDDHPLVADSLNNLGNLYRLQEQYEDARLHYQRALRVWKEALGDDHPSAAMTLNNLGDVYYDQRDYEGAEQYYRRALAIQHEVLDGEHPGVAESLNDLGNVFRARGDYEGAKEYHQRALEMREHVLGADHPLVADPLVGLATIALELGDPASARVYAERAVSIREATVAAPGQLAEARFVLARALWSDRPERARARALAEQARRSWRRTCCGTARRESTWTRAGSSRMASPAGPQTSRSTSWPPPNSTSRQVRPDPRGSSTSRKSPPASVRRDSRPPAKPPPVSSPAVAKRARPGSGLKAHERALGERRRDATGQHGPRPVHGLGLDKVCCRVRRDGLHWVRARSKVRADRRSTDRALGRHERGRDPTEAYGIIGSER